MALELVGTRVISASVTFAHASQLGRDARELPPGTYRIDTHEDVFCGAFAPVYVATSIDLIVEDHGGSTTRLVLPSDLAAAIARDAARCDFLDDASENPPTTGFKAGP